MAMRFLLNGVDMGQAVVRLGKLPGFITQAELGTVGIAGIPFDDPAGTLTVAGWQTFTVDEDQGPAGQQRLWTGYIADRKYQRGLGTSLVTGGARLIDTSIVELNTILSFRLFPPSDTAAKRPAETDVQRVQWLLTTTYLKPTVHDYGFVNTSGGVNMDAADYRGQSAYSLLSDCAQASGKNFFIYFDESKNAVGLYYDLDTNNNYTCTLKLSDLLSDWDGVTTFAYDTDAYLERDPSRVYSGVQVPYSGTASPAYVTSATIASNFVARDTTAPNVNTKSSAVATASGNRYLSSINTESDRIYLTVQLPASKVTLIRAGMRIQLKSTYMPDLSSFTYCRIMRVEAKQDEMTPDLYNLAMELIPPDPTPPVTNVGPFCFFLATSAGNAGGPGYIQFTMNNPGDPTKRAYGYVTTGSSGATIVGDEFTVIAGTPNYNFQCSGDSTAGNGAHVDGSTLISGLYSADHGSGTGLFYNFTAGVPVTFNFYVTYLAAGGLAYTTGAELAIPSIYTGGITSPVAIPHMTYVQGAGSAGSVSPTGTLFIGSVTMTYNP